MKMESDINEDNKADFIANGTSTFNIPNDFYAGLDENQEIELTEGLVSAIYNELSEKITDDVDTMGLWIDYDQGVLENSIKLDTLNDMEKYGVDEINPLYEFFKMTLGE